MSGTPRFQLTPPPGPKKPLAPGKDRVLHVFGSRDIGKERTREIKGGDDGTLLYKVELNNGGHLDWKPHVKIWRCNDGDEAALIGTVVFHHHFWNRAHVTVNINNRDTDLTQVVVKTHSFTSPTTGQVYQWQRDDFYPNLKMNCRNQCNQVVASFSPEKKKGGGKKSGRRKEEKTSEEKTSEEKMSEEKTSEEKTGEEKTGEEKTSEEKKSEEKKSEKQGLITITPKLENMTDEVVVTAVAMMEFARKEALRNEDYTVGY